MNLVAKCMLTLLQQALSLSNDSRPQVNTGRRTHPCLFTACCRSTEAALQAPAARRVRARDPAAGSGLRLIRAHVDKQSVTKTWNLCLPAHDPPFFSISCTSHSPAYGYGQKQQRPTWRRLATAAEVEIFRLSLNTTHRKNTKNWSIHIKVIENRLD